MSTAPDPTTSADDDGVQPPRPPFIRRVRIRNYKSIAFCDVTLEPLTILVGRNASGKSNFLDALAFVRDVTVDGLRAAITKHGGPDAVLCRTQGEQEMSFEFVGCESPNEPDGRYPIEYKLKVTFPSGGEPRIDVDEYISEVGGEQFGYRYRDGFAQFVSGEKPKARMPPGMMDRPILTLFERGGAWALGDDLGSLAHYNFDPRLMRVPQPQHTGGLLAQDGRNLAGVLRQMKESHPFWFHRVNDYLRAVTPDIQIAGTLDLGGFEILKFAVRTGETTPPLELTAASMSDGTLRTVAALVAAFQEIPPDGSPSLVAIEEPETALHPAAMRALVSALDEATLRTQVLITTHSPDLLDAEGVKPENVRVVRMIDGKTVIAPVDAASVEIVEREFNTLAGLERQDRLHADLDDIERQQQLAHETQGAGA